MLGAWYRQEYNTERPDSSLDGPDPDEVFCELRYDLRPYTGTGLTFTLSQKSGTAHCIKFA